MVGSPEVKFVYSPDGNSIFDSNLDGVIVWCQIVNQNANSKECLQLLSYYLLRLCLSHCHLSVKLVSFLCHLYQHVVNKYVFNTVKFEILT